MFYYHFCFELQAQSRSESNDVGPLKRLEFVKKLILWSLLRLKMMLPEIRWVGAVGGFVPLRRLISAVQCADFSASYSGRAHFEKAISVLICLALRQCAARRIFTPTATKEIIHSSPIPTFSLDEWII